MAIEAGRPVWTAEPFGATLLDTTIGDMLDRQAARFVEREAVVFPELGICWTYAESRSRVDRLALGLIRLGIEAGERVAVLAPNVPEWLLLELCAGQDRRRAGDGGHRVSPARAGLPTAPGTGRGAVHRAVASRQRLSRVRPGGGGGSLARLPRQIAHCHAMELLSLGDSVGAEDALRMGLINRIVLAEDVVPTALDVARRIAGNGPAAIQAVKRAVREGSGLPLAGAYDLEDTAKAAIMATEDAREGPLAFMQKRAPVYRGR